jgi:hypothetical protein
MHRAPLIPACEARSPGTDEAMARRHRVQAQATLTPSGTLDLLGPDDPEWDALVMQCREWHPFYLSAFLGAEAAFYAAQATLLVFRGRAGIAVYPVLLLPFRHAGQEVFDLRGTLYAGPTSNADDRRLHLSLVNGLRAALRESARSYGWITDFCRLNPFVPRAENTDGPGVDHVYVDLTRGYECVRNGYARTARSDVRRAYAGAVEFRPLLDELEHRSFASLYALRMRSLGAARRYRFDDAYFSTLFRTFRDWSLATGAFIEGRLAGAMLEITGNGYVFFYLRAVDPAVRHLRVDHGLDDLGIRLGIEAGNKVCVLGGGVRGNDGVYRYKKSFSPTSFAHVCQATVLDQERYDELCASCRDGECPPLFFPPYRREQ